MPLYPCLLNVLKSPKKWGNIKRKISCQDELREATQLKKIEILAEHFGIDKEFAKKILRVVIDEVVENHKVIAKNNA